MTHGVRMRSGYPVVWSECKCVSRNRAFLHDPGEKCPVAGIELGRNAGRGNVDETVSSSLIESDHPVPQRLPVHPADRGRLSPRGSIEYRSDCQQTARLRNVLRTLRKPANLTDV